MAYSRPNGQLAHGELWGSHRYSGMTSVPSVRSDMAGHSVERPRSVISKPSVKGQIVHMLGFVSS